MLPALHRAASECTLWEAPLEDLVPWLLHEPGALAALGARAQQERQALQAAIDGRWQKHRVAGESQRQEGLATAEGPGQPAGAAGADAAAHVQMAAEAGADERQLVDEAGAGGTSAWTISSQGPLPGASAAPQAVAGDDAGDAGAALEGRPAASAASSDVEALRREVVGRLDELSAQLRHTLSAASLVQSVAALGPGQGRAGLQRGAARGGGASPPPGSPPGLAGLRRRHWSYGMLH